MGSRHQPACDPVDRIEWRDAATLNSNLWNPNVVFNPELELLERNILKMGWVQPILINPDGLIIDGFHRWQLARSSKKLLERYGGKVPCSVIQVGQVEAMLLTVRMNRARGTHVATRMHELVSRLLNEFHMDPAELALEIGATKDEVELLSQENVFKARNLKDYRYGRAWYPVEKESKSGESESETS